LSETGGFTAMDRTAATACSVPVCRHGVDNRPERRSKNRNVACVVPTAKECRALKYWKHTAALFCWDTKRSEDRT
jgi:hypothetical protein